jgi:hypothetical protein
LFAFSLYSVKYEVHDDPTRNKYPYSRWRRVEEEVEEPVPVPASAKKPTVKQQKALKRKEKEEKLAAKEERRRLRKRYVLQALMTFKSIC